MLYKALKWATGNIDLLIKQRRQISSYINRLGLSYVSQCTVDDLLMAKSHLFRQYRSFTIIWSVISVLSITAVLFLTEETWIRALVVETPEVVIVPGILILFRLRNFAWYRTIKLKAPESNYTIIYGPVNEEGYSQMVYLAEDTETLSVSTKESSRSSDEGEGESGSARYTVETAV